MSQAPPQNRLQTSVRLGPDAEPRTVAIAADFTGALAVAALREKRT